MFVIQCLIDKSASWYNCTVVQKNKTTRVDLEQDEQKHIECSNVDLSHLEKKQYVNVTLNRVDWIIAFNFRQQKESIRFVDNRVLFKLKQIMPNYKAKLSLTMNE